MPRSASVGLMSLLIGSLASAAPPAQVVYESGKLLLIGTLRSLTLISERVQLFWLYERGCW